MLNNTQVQNVIMQSENIITLAKKCHVMTFCDNENVDEMQDQSTGYVEVKLIAGSLSKAFDTHYRIQFSSKKICS